MDTPSIGLLDYDSPSARAWEEEIRLPQVRLRRDAATSPVPDAETLRRCAWEIGEERPTDAYEPAEHHVGLVAVAPQQGFAHWRILPRWVDETARKRGGAWNNCRLVLRLYDVSYIQFNGFNAHRLQDEPLPALYGQRFFALPRAGTVQLAEVGFVLRSGEFIPAARSQAVAFARDTASPNRDQTALFVDEQGRIERVGNVWQQESFLRERLRPKLRPALRIAACTLVTDAQGMPPSFVRELAIQQRALGHDVHVFLPASDNLHQPREVDGVQYQPLALPATDSPLQTAQAFAAVVEDRLRDGRAFDLFHHHEWMAGLAAQRLRRPRVLALTSLESTRRNGAPATALSHSVERAERAIARTFDHVLTPDWLRERAIAELGLDGGHVHAFPMEGRLANEWDCDLDYGHVKGEIGVGPLDRLLLYVGPLEHGAGVDLLLESLPTQLRRTGNLRLAFVGSGNLHGQLQQRAHQLGVAHATRLLGHREGAQVNRLMRAAEALVLPSRCRVPFDDAVVDLARKAGRPVVTTHGGPTHLIRHEENGLITYDNPGSMVWAMDRILSDPVHAERMGRNGRRQDGAAQNWSDVARRYLDWCANRFSELTRFEI